MFQLITNLFSLGGIAAFLFGIYQYWKRKKEEKERNLSKEVYEPVLNEVALMLNAISIEHGVTIAPVVWSEGRDATLGTLLKRDDPDLFDRLNAFHGLIMDFDTEFHTQIVVPTRSTIELFKDEIYGRDKLLDSNDKLFEEHRNKLTSLHHDRIMPLGQEILRKLQEKLRI